MKSIKILMIAALTILPFIACKNQASNDKKEQTEISENPKQTLATDETYTCTMHPEVMSDKPGKCPKCGMDLTKEKMTPEQMKMMKEGTYIKPKE